MSGSVQPPKPDLLKAWTPLALPGRLERRARAALESIAGDLTRYVDRAEEDRLHFGIDLGEGWAGVALFLAHASRWDERCAPAADTLLRIAADHALQYPTPTGLFGGLAGVGWVMEYLRVHADWRPALDLEEIDRKFESFVTSCEDAPEMDLEAGLSGIAIYLLERPRTAGIRRALSAIAVSLAGEISDHLARPKADRDLGIAHGLPGILATLARLTCDGESHSSDQGPLQRGLRHLSSLEHPVFGFPCDEFAKSLAPPRLAWCYGDLGIACAFSAAKSVAPSDEVGAIMGELARRCGERVVARDPRRARLRESGLCHGAAGGVTLLQSLGIHTGDPRYLRKSADYLEVLLEMGDRNGYGGFDAPAMVPAVGSPPSSPTPGFLRGSSGIGLTLISALEPLRPGWHRVLLASV